MKVGDVVIITSVHEIDEDFFSIGETAVVTDIDWAGDVWAKFENGEVYCIQKGYSTCELLKERKI